ncbi:alpha/beta hydrolase [Actinomadura vinacea]|uniref:Alpha/beta hydrolase n=2 Tax=Actinomadura vinacea TaxID=115336 RepID=A0ABN3K176_9ACTN
MAAGLAAASMAPVPVAAQGRPTGARARVRLPVPSGPHEIGTVPLHLVDRSRPDPWAGPPAYRELMVSVWYPAVRTGGHQIAPHMEPGAAERFGAVTRHRIPPGTVDWAATRTHARQGAPADPRGGRRPVVLYSPGAGDPRTWGTVLVEELASRGYVVVTIDHTYESPGVQFPDGSVRNNDRLFEEIAQAEQNGTFPALLRKVLGARIGDTRFVLDRLPTLPHGLSGVVDLDRIGMFGQSGGGFTAAQGMYEDRRIRAGIDLDGTLEFNREPDGTNLSPVAVHGLRRPFMLMGRQGSDHTTEPSWKAFWSHSTGWRRDLTLRGSKHQTYTDLAAIMPRTGLPRNVVEDAIGTTDPARAVAAQRAYVTSFFDRWLRHRDDHLLDGPSPRYPELAFVD